jgi:ribonuclease BN (tRNA processing enzyme)
VSRAQGGEAAGPYLELAVLGSGSAFSTVGHNSGYLLDGQLLLDCGAPVTSLLGQMGRSSADIKAVAISHLHGDHVLHLPMLVAARALAHPDSAPLRIVGPKGTAECLDQLGRMALGGSFWDHILEVQAPTVERWAAGQSRALGDFGLTAYRVDHSSVLECLAFRIERHGISLGYSGDTTLCPGIRELAASVQHLLCECSSMTGPAPIHLWRAEVEALMEEARPTRFILTHLFEREPVPGAILASDGLILRLRPAAAY